MSAFAIPPVTLYTRVLPLDNARTFVDLIFGNYDKDENGSIDFSEFIVAMNSSMSSSVEEKLRMAFCLFDRDKSGTISVKEMVEVIGTLYSVEGHKQVGVDGMICSAASPLEQFYSFAVLQFCSFTVLQYLLHRARPPNALRCFLVNLTEILTERSPRRSLSGAASKMMASLGCSTTCRQRVADVRTVVS